MEFIFHSRYVNGRRPIRDEEGNITSLGILEETVDENSSYITTNIQQYYVEDSSSYSVTELEVGEYVTVEFDYGDVIKICDLYRVS